MSDQSRNYVSEDRILTAAGDLLSDHNDDTDWDRAICTLVARVLGRPDNVEAHTYIIRYNARRPDDATRSDG